MYESDYAVSSLPPLPEPVPAQPVEVVWIVVRRFGKRGGKKVLVQRVPKWSLIVKGGKACHHRRPEIVSHRKVWC